MTDEELLKLFNTWKSQRERSEVLSFLTSRKVGVRTADALERGEYDKKPRSKLRKVLLEIAGLRAS
jgi:hypothetical protein